jgi:hypothetical protein
MGIESTKFNFKIFQIDKFHFELKGKSNDEIVEKIRDNHKNHLLSKGSIEPNSKKPFDKYVIEDYTFYTYTYNHLKDQNYWKIFLPDELSINQDFQIIEFSFVLFIIYKDHIYCTIGGNGISVIKKYINNFFGIELYQHFAKPIDDIAISITMRGVTGKLSKMSYTYNNSQTIKDSLVYTEIPLKLKIIIREELLKGFLKKYNIDKEISLMEVGSYFSIKKRLDFGGLKLLIKDIYQIQNNKDKFSHLSLFNRIKDEELINNLDFELKILLKNDVLKHNNGSFTQNNNILEFVNYKNLEKFYECSNYKLHFKKHRKFNDVQVKGRDNLYYEATKYLFNNIENIQENIDSELNKKFFDLSIIGILDDKEITFDNFFNHIVAELPYYGKKYFRIEKEWFLLDDLFLKQLTLDAKSYYEENELKEAILLPWPFGDEDSYNSKYTSKGYYIFDKKIRENIELCDILFINETDIYFIHVKNGFNTQMRSLANQIILSSQRLWNDLNNVNGSSYLKNSIKYYNELTPLKPINFKELYEKLLNGKLKINFVMAYKYESYKGRSAIEKIELSNSNIAKFSLIQTVNEIKTFKNFKIYIKDISQIK